MSIKDELNRRQQQRDALKAEEDADKKKKNETLKGNEGKLRAYQSARENELGGLGIVTHIENMRMTFTYKGVTVVVDPSLDGFSLFTTKPQKNSPFAQILPGSKKAVSNVDELDLYLAEVIDLVNQGRL